jgi:hypothetical protein
MFAVVNVADPAIGIIGGSIFYYRHQSVAYAERVRGQPWTAIKRGGFRVVPVRVLDAGAAPDGGLLGELRNMRKACGRSGGTHICATLLDEIMAALAGGTPRSPAEREDR